MTRRGSTIGTLILVGLALAILAAVISVRMGAEVHLPYTEEVWILDVEYFHEENYTIFYMPSPPRPFLKVRGIHNITEFPAKYLMSWTNIKSFQGEYNRLEVLIAIDS